MEKQENIELKDESIEEIKRQCNLIERNKKLLNRQQKLTQYPNRDDYQRDYGRILYSSAFRRLQGKMQILGIESSSFFRNRLTHSLEVAQIAKGIRWQLDKTCYGEDSKLSNMFLLEAAALAHDIGHPAFGHKGERVLDELVSDVGLRFEGNAQNYRVIRSLETKDPELKGLNLTYRTLLAINKYLIKENKNVKKFMYKDDYKYLNSFRVKHNLKNIRTLDAQIIELADDIAYAVHDLEDALSQKYFTIDELLYELKVENDNSLNLENTDIEYAYKIFESLVKKAKNIAETASSYKNLQEYSQIFRKKMTSLLTNEFIMNIDLSKISKEEAEEHGTNVGNYELNLGKNKCLCKLLSKKIFKCVSRNPDVALYELRGEKVIKALFNLYTDQIRNHDGILLPPDYRPNILSSDKKKTIEKKYARSAADYIAGMMDTFAISTYEELFDTSFSKIDI